MDDVSLHYHPRSKFRIAVFRALQLGDMLCAVPVLRALRASYPDATVTLIGLPWARQLVGRYDRYIDDFIAFPGHPGMPERAPQLDAMPGFLAEVQQRRLDLALQLHGSGRLTNALVSLFGAERCAGFSEPSAYHPADGTFITWPEGGNEVRRLLALAEALGLAPCGEWLEFPVHDADRAELRELAGAGGWELDPGEYACIHPGARHAVKRWAPERFAAVADGLAAQGLSVVLTGTAHEAPVTRAVARAMRSPAIDAAGPMSLGALAALLRDARLVVCNDTGVSHLAAALRVPSVVIFLASDPERWLPLDRTLHHGLYDPSTCVLRGAVVRSIGRACPDGISPAHVLREIELLPMPERADVA